MLALLLGAAPAAADDDVPWAQGVDPGIQEEANRLFADANVLFAQQAFTEALVKYRAAIAIWDHPLIRYNLAVTLIRLDRFRDATVELDHSLRYGAQPFDAAHYQEALGYRRLLAGRVTTQRRPSRVRAAWILGGAGTLAVATGIGLGLYANHVYEAQYDNGNCSGDMCNATGLAETSRARTWGTVGTVTAVVGVATIGTGIIVFYTAPFDRVEVVPSVGPESAGITLSARF